MGETGADRRLLGTFDKTVVDGGDYTVIKIDDEAARRFKNNYINTYGGDPVQITGTADPVVGAPVCKSGTMTHFICGKVTSINQRLSNSAVTVPNAFGASLCAITGDSGGPIVTGTKALGITSAASMGGAMAPRGCTGSRSTRSSRTTRA